MIVFQLQGEAGYVASLTTITSAKGFASAGLEPTSGVFSGLKAKSALITVETASINFTLDGTAPTAAAGTNVGHQMDAGQSFVVNGWMSVRNFSCINRVDGNGAIVKYTLFF